MWAGWSRLEILKLWPFLCLGGKLQSRSLICNVRVEASDGCKWQMVAVTKIFVFRANYLLTSQNELNSLKSFEHLSIGQFVTPSQSITFSHHFSLTLYLFVSLSFRAAEQWNGIIGDLVSGSADMSFAPLSVSK